MKTFGWSIGITVIGCIAGFIYGGWQALALVVLLCILEVSLSFDNAIVNATILERMSRFWQRMFLTVGMLIAVFGMRLLFPLVIVGVSAQLSPWGAIELALEKGDAHSPGTYGYVLHEAHPVIAAFGGMFLLMLFLDFVFESRELHWLRWIERPLAKVGKVGNMSVITAMAVLLVAALVIASPDRSAEVLIAGVLGIGSYLLISALGEFFETSADESMENRAAGVPLVGKAAFFLFLYLEVLDASFSFDGVIGAFAITSDPVIIAIGLGVGALFIRSLTIYLVREGTLKEFVYLEHGAMWAIGALAVILVISIQWQLPEVVTGLVGVFFIAGGWISSLVHNRRSRLPELATV